MSLIYVPKGEALEYAFYGINHYVGCSHGCTYCYMKKMFERHRTPGFETPRVKLDPVDFVRALSKELLKFAGMKKRVQLCFATDPYIPLDGKLKLTRAVIHLLREMDIPFQVLTKAGDLAQRDFDLYGPSDLFGVTLTTLERSAEWEPRAASPAQRIANLKAAKTRGIKTWVSLEPVLYQTEALDIIKQTHAFVDLYKIGKLNHGDTQGGLKAFAEAAAALCEELGVKYYLKENLARLLGAGSFTNTDWRMI